MEEETNYFFSGEKDDGSHPPEALLRISAPSFSVCFPLAVSPLSNARREKEPLLNDRRDTEKSAFGRIQAIALPLRRRHVRSFYVHEDSKP